MQNDFIAAIHSKNKIRLTFFSKEDRSLLIRTCAPMDFGASRHATNKSDRFHFWDYDSDTKNHTLSLLPNQVKSIEILEQTFNPAEFVTWSPNWIVARDWGQYS
jgi:hypothetical protein